jgi:SAM-dependent methyltransferase
VAEFDEKSYWRDRHDDHKGRLVAVGIDTISERANQQVYRQLVQRYERLLDRLDLPKGTTALDAGSGVGSFTRLLHGRGFEVTALDISQTALDGIDLPIAKVCSPIAKAGFGEQSFEYVHSFDVLYHIMDDDEWAASLAAVGSWSSRFVVLHERFSRVDQWYPSKIMKMRSRQRSAEILRRAGFREAMSTPTYFITRNLLTYRLSALAPVSAHRFDRWVLDRFGESGLVHALSSHRIKVFERV